MNACFLRRDRDSRLRTMQRAHSHEPEISTRN
jgi:hypothetical protein